MHCIATAAGPSYGDKPTAGGWSTSRRSHKQPSSRDSDYLATIPRLRARAASRSRAAPPARCRDARGSPDDLQRPHHDARGGPAGTGDTPPARAREDRCRARVGTARTPAPGTQAARDCRDTGRRTSGNGAAATETADAPTGDTAASGSAAPTGSVGKGGERTVSGPMGGEGTGPTHETDDQDQAHMPPDPVTIEDPSTAHEPEEDQDPSAPTQNTGVGAARAARASPARLPTGT